MNVIKLFALLLMVISLPMLTSANAPGQNSGTELTPLHMCVWDPLGKAGPAGQIMKEAQIVAHSWGINLTFDVYTEERIPIDEFKLGRCDMVNLLDFRAREFNSFTGSLGAVGAIQSYEQLGVIIKSLSSEKASKLMKVGDYEVVGIGPAGAIFLFTRDRSILQPGDFAGKRMAVIDDIPEASYLTKKHGITPVSSAIFNSMLKFNNGVVDLTTAPAIVYEPFEMYKGLEPNGGIYKEPLLYITMQIVARADKLPPGIAQKTREYALKKFPDFVKFVKDPEATIPEKYWITIPDDLIDFWHEDFRESRLHLADMGIYDRKTLKLMRKVRCKFNPDHAECSAKVKE